MSTKVGQVSIKEPLVLDQRTEAFEDARDMLLREGATGDGDIRPPEYQGGGHDEYRVYAHPTTGRYAGQVIYVAVTE